MSICCGTLDEGTVPDLKLLRVQLQHMRSFDSHTTTFTSGREAQRGALVPQSAGGTAAVSPVSCALSRAQEKWDPNEGMLRQLESRLRRYQEKGVKRRGDLVLAMEKAHTHMELAQTCTTQFKVDGEEHLQALRRLLADTKSAAECVLNRPEIVISETAKTIGEEADDSADTCEEDGSLMSRLEGMQRAQRVIRHQLEDAFGFGAPSSLASAAAVDKIKAELQKERDEADARLSALKESFVAIVQQALDELELLRRDRLETEALCVRILS
ncbi:hypothetical protein TraAM80_06819 [Trypanosoma rangeli]|uniref:Uncharacterized protein n=1 Tax=Trypanosoma rangeli TaxID=5698 RepID=A0A422N8C6_TRYRA|nr:uncharacterized protein TraAM80_06819 [Trypanosoma rangeli]RNF01696.1 hypothetical protein TraAM80_06819 [Trypanosoma rangeli]|eukprot:RNF01696.1 hypothetical protein TraAM80_06819 [Trypanosoma rangeli]